MDFTDTPEEAAFRAECRSFLDANAVLKRRDRPDITKRLADRELLAAAKAWQATKADAGFAGITWPREWGGRGATPMHAIIFGQEEDRYDLPTALLSVSLGMCVPTVLALGDEATKLRFVRPGLRAEELWCQLFSEPSAGSDLAAVRMRAVRDGDEWCINGQKVWTSHAQLADFGLLLTRTDPSVPKHKGMTMFWVDMRAPGIEVRPIKQIGGHSGFNEVYFTDVRISDSQRLGDVGGGWKASLITLMNERLAIGGSRGAVWEDVLAMLRGFAGKDGLPTDPAFRQRLANWYIRAEGVKLTRLRTMTTLSRGQTPGPESAIGKLVNANLTQELASIALDLQGLHGLITEPEMSPISGLFQDSFLRAPGGRIAGGTDEILRNIIAERVLGLPPEPREDKDRPFRELR
jgi:alkylation response protein AidB-like acyl-CoA dehydrogenase